jgi:hypothetical protein
MVTELGFGQSLVVANINQQAVLLDDFLDNEFLVRLSSYLVTYAKAHALERRMVGGVSARFAGRFEFDLNSTVSGLHDRAQPEFRLRLANPSLTWNKHAHEIAAGWLSINPTRASYEPKRRCHCNATKVSQFFYLASAPPS